MMRTSAQPTLPTVAPPAAFVFLGPTPGLISDEGSSRNGSKGKTLSIVGGDIEIVEGGDGQKLSMQRVRNTKVGIGLCNH
jgi:hypothetical protein